MLSSPKLTDDECLPFTIELLYFSKIFFWNSNDKTNDKFLLVFTFFIKTENFVSLSVSCLTCMF